MTAGVVARGRESLDLQALTLAIATLVMEAMPIVVIVAMLGKIPGNHAETISAWGVLGMMAVALVATRWLARQEISATRRWLLGALITIVALQVIGRLDLSESLRVWDVGWVGDLADPDSQAFRKFGRVDHTVSGFLLIFVWFRGVLLGRADMTDRALLPAMTMAAVFFTIGFIGGDDTGVIATVRIAAVVYVMVTLAVVAFRAAIRSQPAGGVEGSFRANSVSFVATLSLVWAAVAVFMLIVLLVIAAVAGTGVAQPVLDVLGDVLRVIVTGIAYLFWPLGWLIQQLGEAGDPPEQPIAPVFLDGFGEPLNPDAEVDELDPASGTGALLVRVFGGIGLVLLFALLVILMFRRLAARSVVDDEERDSLWAEATVMDDFLGSLRNLRNRLRRGPASASGDAPLAQLYFDVLADAERRGNARPLARTPLQFARSLRSQYRSEVPVEISERFSRLRYAGAPTDAADVERLQLAWTMLKEAP